MCSFHNAVRGREMLQYRDQDGTFQLVAEMLFLPSQYCHSRDASDIQAGRQPDRSIAVSIFLLFQPSHLRSLQRAQNADGLMQKMMFCVILPGHMGVTLSHSPR